ncbi:MAG: DUF1003 domain-containing protein [Erysipelothrix sp.]|nr:DUF1003 domain-containing protein [Erysipelothrix sp.]
MSNKTSTQINQLPTYIQKAILKQHPELKETDMITSNELLKIRLKEVEKSIQSDHRKVHKIDEEILESIHQQELITSHTTQDTKTLTLGQRAADSIAKFGGSWRFVITFSIIMILWISINSIALFTKPFDPYPFILLNLVLSFLAALQAPIIMMSQNRQEERDREQAMSNYKVNLKSEIEIRLLHEKMNHLIYEQMGHLMEIQDIQIELLNQLNSKNTPQE